MKNNFYLLFSILLVLGSVSAYAQVGIGTSSPAPSAALEVTTTTNNKGILIPRITAAQKDAISNPAEGLMIYQTSSPAGFYYYTGTSWKLMVTQMDLDTKLSTVDATLSLNTKVDKVTGKELSSNDYTTTEKTKLGSITGTNTGDQDLSALATTASVALKANTTDLNNSLASKVDKVTGKDLSSNDYTDAEKTKLAAITGSNTGDQTTISGNAGTATKFAAPKNINGVAFDGSSNITISAAAETLVGTALNSAIVNSSLTSLGTLSNLTVSNPIVGNITGNAATVSTNASLTGVVTSTGNTTAIANSAISNAMLANGAVANLTGTNTGDQTATTVTNVAAGTIAAITVQGALNELDTEKAPLASPTFTGAPVLPTGTTGITQTAANNSTKLATTAYADAAAGAAITGKQNTLTNSAGLAGALADETGTGLAVFATSPTLVTPVIGAATGTSLSVSGQLTSTIATGTAPLVVTSITPVANLSIGGNAATATNLAAGSGGTMPYQSGEGITAMLANGTAGQVLGSNGTTLAPSWVNAATGDMTLAGTQTVTGAKTFGAAGDVGKLVIAGSTSGTTILNANSTAGAGTVVLPTTGTLATLEGTETLTNKTLTSTASITGSSTLTLAAGGTDQDVTITPTGTGNTVLNGDAVVGTSSPNASAVLEAASTTKGFLPPRMTQVQRNAIATPAAGLMVWCTNCGTAGELQVNNGTTWTNMVGGTASGTVPGAPTNIVGTPGNAQASVAFTAPASDGGSAITTYTVTSSPASTPVSGSNSPLLVTGLTNGTPYTFNVVATNAAGNSSASVASSAVTPSALPMSSAYVGGTKKTFMAYNLGVNGTQNPLDYESGNNNGALYQWGRQTDGHEVRTNLSTQAGPVAAPVANKFITNSTSPYDWISPQNENLWLDASKTANDPCPAGFRVPTQAQWGGLFRDGTTGGAPGTATRNTWTWTGNGYTVGANLYLPAAGFRFVEDATLLNVGTNGYYWSSTVNGTNAYYLSFYSVLVNPGISLYRGFGFSVRCISE